MASTLACALCPETVPQPDVVLGYREASAGPGWPILAHLVCAAADGAQVRGEWTAEDTRRLEQAWSTGPP